MNYEEDERRKQRTRITWPVQSVKIVTEKRNDKAFNQHEQRNQTALPLYPVYSLLSVGMLNGRFNQSLMAPLIFH